MQPIPAQSPSSILADSLASFSKSANQAFADIQARCQSEVAQAAIDLRDARHARDQAVQALHTAQLESQGLKREADLSKASLQQVEITVAHQKETIDRLRRETAQWKDQSRNWQEHFLRVEQERCALASKVDELVSERLFWIQQQHPSISASSSAFPSTPASAHSYATGTTSAPSSSSTKRASSFHPIKAQSGTGAPMTPRAESPLEALSLSRPRPPTKLKAAPNKRPTGQRKLATAASTTANTNSAIPGSTTTTAVGGGGAAAGVEDTTVTTVAVKQASRPSTAVPQVVLLRRVHAVVHVKEEVDSSSEAGLDVDDDGDGSQRGDKVCGDGGQVGEGEGDESTPRHKLSRTGGGGGSGAQNAWEGRGEASPRKLVRSVRKVRQWKRVEDESSGDDDHDHDDEDDDSDGDDGDYGGDDGDWNETRKAGKTRVGRNEESEEDELMLGAETNHQEVYGVQPLTPNRKRKFLSTTRAKSSTKRRI